jgi:predicted nuclease of predicted toxin-antitoxin system
MRLYLDDDMANPLLTQLLRKAGHDVVLPADVGRGGNHDADQLRYSIQEDRVILTGNYRDFPHLHELVREASGHHPGILLVRKDNDPSRDLSVGDIVRAIRNLLAANVPLADELHILNHWR